MIDYKQIKADLTVHRLIAWMMLSMVIVYNVICHLFATEIQIAMAEEQRVLIRSILYVVGIILFPLGSFLRHILLRLNQTMPGDKSAQSRYLMTTIITLAHIETVGVFGFVLFILGDPYNSLYIFSLLALLGIYLHRPKEYEYREIVEALKGRN